MDIFPLTKNTQLPYSIEMPLFASAIGGTKSEWGELPNKTDLAEAISEFSGEDTSDMKNCIVITPLCQVKLRFFIVNEKM